MKLIVSESLTVSLATNVMNHQKRPHDDAEAEVELSSGSASSTGMPLQRTVSTPRRRYYNPEWEKEPELKGWLARNPAGAASGKAAKCTVCCLALRAHHGDLVKHGTKSETHLEKMELMKSRSQLRLGDLGMQMT